MDAKQYRLMLYLLSTMVIDELMTDFGYSFEKAVNDFYQSSTYKLLEDKKTDYWLFSPKIIVRDFLEATHGSHK